MKTIFTFLICFLFSLQHFSQEIIVDSSTSVLLIPFDRFEFHSEFTLAELNKINQLEKDQYYQELLQIFTTAFETYSGNGISYKVINNEGWKQFDSKATYKYIQKEAHYSCDLKDYNLNDYQELLDEYSCTYMLVVPWYKIMESKAKVKTNEVRRIGYYSQHLIDYDIFNWKKERIFYESSKEVQAKATLENLSNKGLLLKDLIPVYGILANKVSIELVQRLED